jgi:hypothetical protein
MNGIVLFLLLAGLSIEKEEHPLDGLTSQPWQNNKMERASVGSSTNLPCLPPVHELRGKQQ